MSIFASYPDIGSREDDDTTDGTVLAYEGSHRYPKPGDPHANVGLATIPAWCVPGRDEPEDYDSDDVGPWVRLDVSTPNSDGNLRTSNAQTVLLSEDAARALAAQLVAWADQPKVHPVVKE